MIAFLLLNCLCFVNEPEAPIESTEPFYQLEIQIQTPEEIDGLSFPIVR